MSECAFCGDKNFRRMNPDISDWCLILKSESLPPLNGISIDVYIEPPVESELRFCGFGCLKNWLEKKMSRFNIAKEAYKQIVKAIIDLEEKHHILCDLPSFIEVDGEKFYRNELHHFCVKRDENGKILIE